MLALVEVLEHVPYGDLVRCRRVNKQWMHLIDHSISKQELVLFVDSERRPNWWEYSGEPVNLKHSVQANSSVFTSEPFFALFSGVKRLFLSFNHFVCNKKRTDELAKHFGDTLEHLQIDYQSNRSTENSTTFELALKKLQTFSYPRKRPSEKDPASFSFMLDSDQLTHLYTELNYQNIPMMAKVAHNLKVLFVTNTVFKKTLKFPNLEVLSSFNEPSTEFLISSLPSLKEFHFAGHSFYNMHGAKSSISDFLERIEPLGRQVDVFWIGLKFTVENSDRLFLSLAKEEWSARFGITPETLDYFKENYFKENCSKLIPFPHIDGFPVQYSNSFGDQLDEQVDRELIELLAKSWHAVAIDNHIPKFKVAKLRTLFEFVSRLNVTYPLKQTELDKLPAIFPHLRMFHLHQTSRTGQPDYLDFSFVSEFKNLYLVDTCEPLPLETIRRMLTDCPHFYRVSFKKEKKKITVRMRRRYYRKTERAFELKLDYDLDFYFDGKESLLEFLRLNKLVLQKEEK